MSDEPCAECKGEGVVHKKYWKQPQVAGVHPAIAAGAPAYRTIATLPCPSCEERAKKMKGTSVFVFTRIEKKEIKDQRVILDGKEAARTLRTEADKAKISAFGGGVFFEHVKELKDGQEISAGDFDGNRVTVRKVKVL